METRNTILDVRDLSVRFGARHVLRDITFHVLEGTSLAVIGPNGSGKTVLFKALIGAIPFEGTVDWAPGVRIGYVPQKLDIERDVPITGLDFLRARPGLRHASGRERVSEVLTLVGLTREVCEQPIGALSGGQFQRLLVAFALVGDPTVLLLDEPTAGVDEPGQERLNELVHRLRLQRGLTVVLISHELTIVSQHATNVLCLSHAQACFGPPTAILTQERLQEAFGLPMAVHLHER
jgi:zinc transport system ATP-binding protein